MANLTVSLRENLKLEGTQYGSRRGFTISGINEAFKRVVTVLSASETALVAVSTARANGTFIKGDIRYIRIANLDPTNYIILTCKDSGNGEFAVKLDKGQSFIYHSDLSGGVVETLDASASALNLAHDATLADLVDIVAIANTANCDVEVFVACV